MKRLPLLLLLAAACLLLAGCLSAQELRNRRAQEHPEWLASLPQADQVRILGGQIAVGDPSGAVWIALGQPDHTVVQATAAGTNVVWNYTETETYVAGTQTVVTHAYPPPRRRHDPPPPPVPVVQTVNTYANREIVRVSVTFADDRVSAISAAQ